MEREDEEEEARREQGGTVKKPSKKALVKCKDCPSSFSTLQGYIKHRAGHGMAGN